MTFTFFHSWIKLIGSWELGSWTHILCAVYVYWTIC